MEAEIYQCVSCGLPPSKSFADSILEVAGFLAGAIGAWAGIQAFLVARESHDANVLREELAPYRALMAAAIEDLQRNLKILQQSSHPALPITRIESNFVGLRPPTSEAADRVLSQAQKIDRSGLFIGAWEASLRPIYEKIEDWWDVVEDSTKSETDRKYAAMRASENVEAFSVMALELITKAARAQLTTGIFGRKRQFRMEPGV